MCDQKFPCFCKSSGQKIRCNNRALSIGQRRCLLEKNAVPTGDVIKDWDIREDEKIYFLLRSEKNKFTIGLGDILECLRFAEKEGEVPKLPVEWWGSEYGQNHNAAKTKAL